MPWTDRFLTRAASGSAVALFVGDSIGAEGQGASTRDNRWISRALVGLRARYQPAGVVGGRGFTPAWYAVSGDSASWAAPYASRAGSLADESWAANLAYKQATLNPTGTETFAVTGTAADLHYLDGPGTFTYAVDGGSAVTVTQGNTFTNKKIRVVLGTAGAHTVTVTGTGTSGQYVVFTGLDEYNGDTLTGIRGIDAGHSGYKSSDYNGANVAAHAAAVALFSPDLILITLGTNDLATLTAAQTKANIVALIAAYRQAVTNAGGTQPSIGVGLTYRPTGNAQWVTTDAALRTIATDDPTVGLVDFATGMGPSSAGGLFSSDALHPSDSGHAKLSQIFLAAMGITASTTDYLGALAQQLAGQLDAKSRSVALSTPAAPRRRRDRRRL